MLMLIVAIERIEVISKYKHGETVTKKGMGHAFAHAHLFLHNDDLISGRPYFISCSKSLKISALKKSEIVMPRPSQSFLIVDTVALLFRPLMILLTVD